MNQTQEFCIHTLITPSEQQQKKPNKQLKRLLQKSEHTRLGGTICATLPLLASLRISQKNQPVSSTKIYIPLLSETNQKKTNGSLLRTTVKQRMKDKLRVILIPVVSWLMFLKDPASPLFHLWGSNMQNIRKQSLITKKNCEHKIRLMVKNSYVSIHQASMKSAIEFRLW